MDLKHSKLQLIPQLGPRIRRYWHLEWRLRKLETQKNKIELKTFISIVNRKRHYSELKVLVNELEYIVDAVQMMEKRKPNGDE